MLHEPANWASIDDIVIKPRSREAGEVNLGAVIPGLCLNLPIQLLITPEKAGHFEPPWVLHVEDSIDDVTCDIPDDGDGKPHYPIFRIDSQDDLDDFCEQSGYIDAILIDMPTTREAAEIANEIKKYMNWRGQIFAKPAVTPADAVTLALSGVDHPVISVGRRGSILRQSSASRISQASLALESYQIAAELEEANVQDFINCLASGASLVMVNSSIPDGFIEALRDEVAHTIKEIGGQDILDISFCDSYVRGRCEV